MAVHNPIERGRGVIDCTCGRLQVGTYGTDFGSRVGFFEHLVSAVAAERQWPDEFYVEGVMASDDW